MSERSGKRIENEEEDGGVRRERSRTRSPSGWVGLNGCLRGPRTLCTDFNTDCVPINYCMSVCETERTSGMEDRAKAFLAHKSQ